MTPPRSRRVRWWRFGGRVAVRTGQPERSASCAAGGFQRPGHHQPGRRPHSIRRHPLPWSTRARLNVPRSFPISEPSSPPAISSRIPGCALRPVPDRHFSHRARLLHHQHARFGQASSRWMPRAPSIRRPIRRTRRLDGGSVAHRRRHYESPRRGRPSRRGRPAQARSVGLRTIGGLPATITVRGRGSDPHARPDADQRRAGPGPCNPATRCPSSSRSARNRPKAPSRWWFSSRQAVNFTGISRACIGPATWPCHDDGMAIHVAALRYVAAGDLGLMRKLNRWTPPRWLRLWMIWATRAGDGWLWRARASRWRSSARRTVVRTGSGRRLRRRWDRRIPGLETPGLPPSALRDRTPRLGGSSASRPLLVSLRPFHDRLRGGHFARGLPIPSCCPLCLRARSAWPLPHPAGHAFPERCAGRRRIGRLAGLCRRTLAGLSAAKLTLS